MLYLYPCLCPCFLDLMFDYYSVCTEINLKLIHKLDCYELLLKKKKKNDFYESMTMTRTLQPSNAHS